MSRWSDWWGPTLATGTVGERWLSRQPVGHLLGSAARFAWFLLLLVIPWWLQPIWVTLYLATEWQLTLWEPKPDATYPFLWLLLNIATETLVVAVLSGGVILLGVRWP